MVEPLSAPSDMLRTRAPLSTEYITPLARPSLEHTKVSSTRTFIRGQSGHTPATPRPLLVSGAAVPARAVAKVAVVELVAVVVVRVPAGEVVDVAVAVIVDAVGEDAQVAAIDAGAVDRHAGVALIVEDVEHAVAVAVIRVARDGGGARAARPLRDRQLAPVQPDLVAQVLLVVVDARVEDPDHDRGVPERRLPGGGGGDAARMRDAGDRRVVEEVPLAGDALAVGARRAGRREARVVRRHRGEARGDRRDDAGGEKRDGGGPGEPGATHGGGKLPPRGRDWQGELEGGQWALAGRPEADQRPPLVISPRRQRRRSAKKASDGRHLDLPPR